LSDFANPPETPGARMGDEPQREMMEEAEHERQVHEAEQYRRETAGTGETPQKRPWWKFWG
jgi:hypothetical protein